MTDIHYSAPPLWWTQTTFGTIILVMFFLTWGLVIVNLCLFLLRQVHAMFQASKAKPKPAKKA